MRQLIIVLFAIVLYSGTFFHGYVLDDNDVIKNNSIVQQGIKSIPEIFSTSFRANIDGDYLYRPVSKALFAIESEIWPDNATAAHIINVLLYAFVCLILYLLLLKFFKEPIVPFIAALIFVAHPIHTEVVANIKSADEILALLFSLFSLYLLYNYSIGGKLYQLLLSAISFFAALLSKESAVIFIAIFPLTLYFFTSFTKRKYLFLLIYLIPLVFYLIIRNNIIGAFNSSVAVNENYLIGIPGFIEREATAIMLLGYDLLILIFPYRLMIDGSYNEFPSIAISDWRFILPFIVLSALLIIALLRIRQKKADSYFIFFFFIAVSPVSNVFLLIGTNYGERLMFVPSIGICVLLAILIVKLFHQKNIQGNFISMFKYPLLATFVFVLAYSIKTSSRSADWKDELTLFKKDAKSAPRSARTQYYLGNQYAVLLPDIFDKTLKSEYSFNGIAALRKAVEILPDYDEAFYSLGKIYSEIESLDSALKYFRLAVESNPMNARFQNNYGDILFKLDRFELAKERFEFAVKLDSLYRDALVNLGTSYARIGQKWLENAQQAQLEEKQDQLERFYSISMTYYDSAIVFLNNSIRIDPGYYHPYNILGIVYRNRNENDRADYYYRMADELKIKGN